jgi:hypothetical protein
MYRGNPLWYFIYKFFQRPGKKGDSFSGPTIYQSYNTFPIAPDMTGMSSNAVQLAAKMKREWE